MSAETSEQHRPGSNRVCVGRSHFEREDGTTSKFVHDEEPHNLPATISEGYAPLALGHRFAMETSRPDKPPVEIEVVRKLGWGGSASVWLVKLSWPDKIRAAEAEGRTVPPRFSVMKVLTAQVSTATACGMYKEADILHTLSHQDKSHPGYRYCPNMQHHQVIESANGAHYALFVRACGTTLGELSLQRPTRVFPPRVVARVMKELLLALTYVHDACNIIHCDIKPDNVFVALRPPDDYQETIASYLVDHPSTTHPPRDAPFLSPDPIITVKSEPLPNFGLRPDLSNLHVDLMDFSAGQIVSEDMDPPPFVGTAPFRAPEMILGDRWSKPIDIWALGCLAFELLAGRELYPLRMYEMDKQHVALLTQTVDIFGSEVFSPEFLSRCKGADAFSKDGGPLAVARPAKTSIHEGLRELVEWHRKANAPSMVGRLWNMFSSTPSKDDATPYDEAELLRASRFITRCLTVDPTLRPTATELLKDEWIANADIGTDV